MTDIDPIWWILLAVVILAVLIAWALVARKRRLDADRTHAAGLRYKAKQGEGVAATSEERAAELQARAREAQQEADQFHREAEDATQRARDERDRVTGSYVDADEIDPDAPRKKG